MFRVALFAFSMLLVNALGSAQEAPARKEVNCERDPRRSEQTWETSEEKCLSELKDVASRSGQTLRLRLENGNTNTFQNKPCDRYSPSTCTEYTLIGYHPAQRAFIIEQGFYEDSLVLLVSDRTGNVTTLSTEPKFSPSGRWFVSVDADEMNGTDYYVTVWSTAPNKPKLELRYHTEKYEYWEFAGWDGDSRIKLKVSAWDGEGELIGHETDAVLTEQGWKLNWPKPEQ